MGKLIAVSGRTLVQSNPTPPGVSFTLVETDIPALRAQAQGSAVLLEKIHLECTCSGNYAAGQTFSGTGSGDIAASTPRVQCQGKSILCEGDAVTLTCSGTVTDTASGTTFPGTATVTVTIQNPNQTSVFASKT